MTAAGVRLVDLTTGAVTSVGSAALTVNTLEPNKYAVSVTGGVTRTIGTPANPVLIDFGSIEIG